MKDKVTPGGRGLAYAGFRKGSDLSRGMEG